MKKILIKIGYAMFIYFPALIVSLIGTGAGFLWESFKYGFGVGTKYFKEKF